MTMTKGPGKKSSHNSLIEMKTKHLGTMLSKEMKSLWKKIQAIEADARREEGSWTEMINLVKWPFIKSTYRFRAILM